MKLPCIHPYNGIRVSNNGNVMPCCYYDEYTPFKDKNGKVIKTDTHTFEEMMDNPDRNKLIEDLENGIQHVGCKRCWDDEKNRGESRRTRDLKLGYTNDKSVKYLELNLGNTCNLACRMCSVGASIKWYGEHQTIYEQDTDLKDDLKYKNWVKEYYKSYETESMFWSELEKELPNIKQIDMYGGEPMLVKKQWETLKKSIELGYAKDQELSFNTNGTIFKEEYIDILKEFKLADIDFTDECLREIIAGYTENEEGVRNLKRQIETIISKINLIRLINKETDVIDCSIKTIEFPITITKEIMNKLILKTDDTLDVSIMGLYS